MNKLSISVEARLPPVSLARENISLETTVISNAVSLAKSYLPTMVASFKNTVSAFKSDAGVSKKLSKSILSMTSIVGKTDYMELSDINLDVPEGFYSNLLKGFITVEEAINGLNELKKTIEDFNTYVAIFITNKDAKKSIKDLLPKIVKSKKDTHDLLELVNSLYSPGSVENTLPYKKLFSSNSDFEKALYKFKSVDEKFAEISISKVKETILEISDNLETVIKLLKEDKIDNMTPEALKNLAEGSYQIGKACEAYSITYFKLLGIMTIVPNLENHITTNLIKN